MLLVSIKVEIKIVDLYRFIVCNKGNKALEQTIQARRRSGLMIKKPSMLHQFTAKMLVVLLFILVLSSSSNEHAIPRSTATYELIHTTDLTTETTGSITMYCRNSTTAEKVPLNEVQFWLNRTNRCDPNLQERGNINAIEVDNFKIKFNLTRHLDGYYTCGKYVNGNRVLESNQKAFVCKHNYCLHATNIYNVTLYALTRACSCSL